MTSFKTLALFCISCLCLAGCPKDDATAANGDGDGDDGSAGSGASASGNNCEKIASENSRLGKELGCTADTNLGAGCAMLYAKNRCTKEWEALTGCLEFDAANFMCDPEKDNHLEPITCTAEKATFDACLEK